MADERDYTFRTFGITATVVVLMLGLSFVPGFRVGGISLKRANIVSDLIRAEDSSELLMADAYFDTTFLGESADAASAERIDSARSLPAAATLDWSIGGPVPPSAGGVRDSAAVRRPSSLADTAEVVEIEDFSALLDTQPAGQMVSGALLLAVLLVNGVTAAILETRPGASNAPKRPEL